MKLSLGHPQQNAMNIDSLSHHLVAFVTHLLILERESRAAASMGS